MPYTNYYMQVASVDPFQAIKDLLREKDIHIEKLRSRIDGLEKQLKTIREAAMIQGDPLSDMKASVAKTRIEFAADKFREYILGSQTNAVPNYDYATQVPQDMSISKTHYKATRNSQADGYSEEPTGILKAYHESLEKLNTEK